MRQQHTWTLDSLDLNGLYAGRCFESLCQQSSMSLVELVFDEWQQIFRCPPQMVHESYSNIEILSKLKLLRFQLASMSRVQTLQAEVVLESGFPDKRFLLDALRVRVVTPEMPAISEAKPVFFTHRDTWYANPIDQVNFWIPIHDVSSDSTVEIFTRYFQHPILNNSECFDYGHFSSNVGWQSSKADQPHSYPKSLIEPNGPRLSIQGAIGTVWCFSGQHLHRTCRQPLLSRVSIDFRCCPIQADALSIPHHVDNRSTGSAKDDFIVVNGCNLIR